MIVLCILKLKIRGMLLSDFVVFWDFIKSPTSSLCYVNTRKRICLSQQVYMCNVTL